MSALGSIEPETGSGARTTTSVPTTADGVALWKIATASRALDVNSRYAYVLWCRDFAATSIVARLDDRVVGFVTGYLRPERPDTLFVWQVAVDEAARGRRAAATMLDDLVARVGVPYLETTVTDDNAASLAMFSGLAERTGAPMERTALFGPAELGAEHDPEFLYRIGPMHLNDRR
ncbi:diaminobutyrate acetyltransferase [Pseudonocardia hydrocarbonoxydans]|uniref:L-2,4-diaminobutyric acid acetyltransferase n=1 Tax=Pseudonocardia hydrocarbonoxydans TaxID=76726 RepID=A0A4Y3WUR4_9PSEU|nr:diaminobutyrate acetyltransferase [Pseudonocardia hydrocarbonoxydans]GEC22625.1 L-2,4-diaminobutyric acid acetyltransferase [Pseudonocardia hydrocarbonoxydans]